MIKVVDVVVDVFDVDVDVFDVDTFDVLLFESMSAVVSVRAFLFANCSSDNKPRSLVDDSEPPNRNGCVGGTYGRFGVNFFLCAGSDMNMKQTKLNL